MDRAKPDIITVYSTVWCPDCKRAKKFFGEQRVPYVNIDIEQDAEAMAFVEKVNGGKHIIPTIVFPDGSMLVEPSNAELAAKLSLQTKAQRQFYDSIVIGSGPAGLTAAFYMAREGMDTLVIEKAGLGGQVGVTQTLKTFPVSTRASPARSSPSGWASRRAALGWKFCRRNPSPTFRPRGRIYASPPATARCTRPKPCCWRPARTTANSACRARRP